ncbi:MAG TPA: IS200/IS605 family transposase [Candidatus Pacearchaeota archaeon]|nr:IS200/IS605 family transposase [Candidatus Pacearchaeota archaeon]
MYRLDKKSNCVFSLCYHLIIVVKYRKKVFENIMLVSDVKTIVQEISESMQVEVIEQECGIDHIHILFRAKPTLDMTKYINLLKGNSSRNIRKKYKSFLKDKLWGDHFWSPSYFLATTGNVTIDILKEYVENQRKEQE